MKAEETGKRKWTKKKIIILLIVIVILAIAVSGVIVWLIGRPEGQSNNRPYIMGNMNMGEGVVSASGLTSMAMQEEIYELDFLETALYVEESYLSIGDSVEKGTRVFKVSEETWKKAKRELQNAVTEADLAWQQGKIDYETGLMEGAETLKLAKVNQKYAKAEYDNAAAKAAAQMEELKSQVEEARKLAEEYSNSINNNYYYNYYRIEELGNTYYDNFTYLMKLYEEWDIQKLENTTDSMSGNSMGGNNMQPDSIRSGGNTGSDKLTVYNLLDELVQEEGNAYKEALKQYEIAVARAEAGLDQAKSNFADLQAQLEQANTEYQQELLSCKADYEITLAESKNAQAVYDTTVQKLEETYAALEDAKEEAEANQTLFEKTINDGYFYTENAGNIVMIGVRKGSYLSGQSLLMAYSNPETVTVTASVSQEDIASVAVGDSAYVMVSGYGNYEGKVLSINPVTQSQSKSSVTYQVTVNLEGDISGLESNLTASVYFGMTGEMMQNMQQMQIRDSDIPEGASGNLDRAGNGSKQEGYEEWEKE